MRQIYSCSHEEVKRKNYKFNWLLVCLGIKKIIYLSPAPELLQWAVEKPRTFWSQDLKSWLCVIIQGDTIPIRNNRFWVGGWVVIGRCLSLYSRSGLLDAATGTVQQLRLCSSGLTHSLGLRRTSPQVLTHLGGARFIVWRLRRLFERMPTRHFWARQACLCLNSDKWSNSPIWNINSLA